MNFLKRNYKYLPSCKHTKKLMSSCQGKLLTKRQTGKGNFIGPSVYSGLTTEIHPDKFEWKIICSLLLKGTHYSMQIHGSPFVNMLGTYSTTSGTITVIGTRNIGPKSTCCGSKP